MLRSIRKAKPSGELIILSAADPLNYSGILTPGPRIAAVSSNRILFRDGVPLAALEAGRIVNLNPEADQEDQRIEYSLKIGRLPPALRPYYA